MAWAKDLRDHVRRIWICDGEIGWKHVEAESAGVVGEDVEEKEDEVIVVAEEEGEGEGEEIDNN